MKFLLLTLILMVYGCGNLPLDKTPAPFDNNMFTQELRSCGKIDVGLMTCPYTKNKTVGELEIPTLFSGEYDIRSTRCSFSQTGRFTKSQPIKIKYEDLLKGKPSSQTTCIFDIKVFIDNMDRGMRGIFVLTDMEEFQPLSVAFLDQHYNDGTGYYQIRRDHSPDLEFLVGTNDVGYLFVEGCGINYEKFIEHVEAVKISKVISKGKTSCVLRFGFLPEDPDKPMRLYTFLYQNFSTDMIRLVAPSITLKGNTLNITMPSEVAFANMAGKTRLFKGSKLKRMSVRVEKDKEYLLRMGTANGRYDIYSIKNGSLKWKSSIQY